MRLYHVSYSNVNSFTNTGKTYSDVDINGKVMDTKRISLSTSPEAGLRGFVDAVTLEYGRLKNEKYINLYVYACEVPDDHIVRPKELRGKIFDIDVTNEHWYVGAEPLTFINVGSIDVSTALRDRVIVEYHDYGLEDESMERRVYGGRVKRARHTALRGRPRKLKRGIVEREPDLTKQTHTGEYYKVVVDHPYVTAMDKFLWLDFNTFATRFFSFLPMLYEVIRLNGMDPIKIELLTMKGSVIHANDTIIGEDSNVVQRRMVELDTKPNSRKLVKLNGNELIEPSLVYL